MNFEKALTLYRNDKTLQILRAEHGDFLFSLERQGISDYNKPSLIKICTYMISTYCLLWSLSTL